MRLGFSTGDTVAQAGAIVNVSKYLVELPVGSVIRNGCDSTDPASAGVYLVKVPSTRPRAELDRGHEWEWFDPATGAHQAIGEMPGVGGLGVAVVSADVFLPAQVIRRGWRGTIGQ
ncbi:hypothetical protein [Mycolicibacterium mageritense]|uniref:hypothetical protein n=1 Tax=Mycolicibacterium mageritense TaxID=53462 RepID=UPI001E4B9EE4|nr:hypothetical protein [Mycolicibacterium mageritense]GJJ24175.1 hypothetical protein MTY414_78490 [Mycolicibacterium mageritense]